MNAPPESPPPSRKPARNDVVVGVIAIAAVAAFGLGLCVALTVVAYVALQEATSTPTQRVAVATAPPIVVALPLEDAEVVVALPPVERPAAPVVKPTVVLPVPRTPVVTAPVAPKPSYVPKPTAAAATPKPGPTPDNPVTPDLPHGKYDPDIHEESFAGILAEEYPKPRKLDGVITSYLKFVSPKGDFVGGGKNRSYDLSVGLKPPYLAFNGGATLATDLWRLEFAPARGAKPLTVGKYLGATRFPFHKAAEPGMSFSGDGRGSNILTGSFAVWQLDLEDDKIVALAVDFLQRSEGKGPPLLGRLRYKSKYE